MPKVSVIVYVKNTEKYIRQCIESIVDQTEKDIEIIVIDGESTDGTVDIIKELCAKDKRIVFFSKGGGVGAQFNYGLSKAMGEYISVVEADDFIPSDMIERQYTIAKKNDLDIVKAGYYYYLEIADESFIYPFQACDSVACDSLITYDDGGMLLDVGLNGFWSGMYRRSFLIDNHICMNETPGASYQDITFSFLTQLYAKKVWFMSDCFYRYRVDNPNASVNSMVGIEKHIHEYEKLRNVLELNDLWIKYKFIFFKWMASSFEWYLTQFPGENVSQWIDKAYDFLNLQICDERSKLTSVSDEIRNVLEPIIEGKKAYFTYIKERCEVNRLLSAYMHEGFNLDEEFVVFGTGNIGKAVVDFLSILNKKIILADNDKGKQNKELYGHVVYSPEYICIEHKMAVYIIANTVHYMAMKKQLMDNGIDRKSIVICNDRGFWLRKIFPLAEKYKIEGI
jgi:glycosyltransferase involved in cell wall biosynthesis